MFRVTSLPRGALEGELALRGIVVQHQDLGFSEVSSGELVTRSPLSPRLPILDSQC